MRADYTEGTMVKGYRTRRARLNISSDFLYVFRIKVLTQKILPTIFNLSKSEHLQSTSQTQLYGKKRSSVFNSQYTFGQD